MYKCLTFIDSQMFNMWFLSSPSLIRSHFINCFGRTSVLQVSSSRESFPKIYVIGWHDITLTWHIQLEFDSCALLYTPFYSGFFSIVSSCCTPSACKCASNSLELNSPPLFVRMAFTHLPVTFSTIAFHSQNFSKTWFLCCRKYTYMLSSINIRKYSALLSNFSLIFPHMPI